VSTICQVSEDYAVCQVSEDYADLFCELFDGLGLGEFRSAGEGWTTDARVVAIAEEVEAEALGGALGAAARVRAPRTSANR
jgi:hypothetical protein